MDRTIRAHIGSKYNLVGVKILKKEDGAKRPKRPMRFCEMVKEAAEGKSFDAGIEDIACPSAIVTLGFEEPVYVDIQPRIKPAETKTVQVAPLGEMENPDVILAILTPKQAMDLSALLNGLEARFSGNLAVCGEATAKPYMGKKPNLTLLCGGARMFAGYKDSELILGAPPETFKELADRIEALSKTCGALCGCLTSDISPRIIQSFKNLGFEKGTDYFFGKVKDFNVRIYLNKDFQGRMKYITFHLPIKGEVKVRKPLTIKRRGDWSDVVVTFGIGEAIDLNTGKGLREVIEDIIRKVKR
jgi:uncharacterized protein (DUF169 family)